MTNTDSIKLKEKTDYSDFTTGSIPVKLIHFALPVLLALFLQSMYGAVDLLVIGHFGTSVDISAVSTGSQIMMMFTNLVNGFSMGITVILGQQIGMGKKKEGGQTIGAGIFLFIWIGLAFTALLTLDADGISKVMQAPVEAFTTTAAYVRICGAGMLVITAYTLIGSIFRGMGDSKTPLIAVAIACVFNIFGDLFFVAVLHMGAAGAALATVLAQAISVVLSLVLIRRQALPFEFNLKMIRREADIMKHITKLGFPLALQDLLVSISFMVILAIVNSLGLAVSAGVGVAEKVCAFIMLVPSAFAQSLSAFVAQNEGAGKTGRAVKSLYTAVGLSLMVGAFMFYLNFFHGDLLAGIFSGDPEIIGLAAQYLKAYAIDCLLTAIFFCYIGFFNGIGQTRFVMMQGLVSAFFVRIPVSWAMSRIRPVSLFKIGLSTPCASATQIVMCLVAFAVIMKKRKSAATAESHTD